MRGEGKKVHCSSSTMQWMGRWIMVYVPEAKFMLEEEERGDECDLSHRLEVGRGRRRPVE